MREKLERNQPLSEIEWAYMERPPRQQHTEYTSSKTCHGFLKPTQISELDGMFFMRYCVSAFLTGFIRTLREDSTYLVQGFHNHRHQTYEGICNPYSVRT